MDQDGIFDHLRRTTPRRDTLIQKCSQVGLTTSMLRRMGIDPADDQPYLGNRAERRKQKALARRARKPHANRRG